MAAALIPCLLRDMDAPAALHWSPRRHIQSCVVRLNARVFPHAPRALFIQSLAMQLWHCPFGGHDLADACMATEIFGQQDQASMINMEFEMFADAASVSPVVMTLHETMPPASIAVQNTPHMPRCL